MNAVRVICITLLLTVFSFRARAEDFTNAIHAFLQQRVEVEKQDVGVVVGIVDEHGSSIAACGKLDNGTDLEVNGDTVFEIASITKTFTGLLLQDMIERGEMKLDDPVAKYLPKSFQVPTRNGREITLLQLAAHTSGLPHNPNNLDPKLSENVFADYSVEGLDAFLSGYQLTRDPGTKFAYSSVGMGLLGFAMARQAGTNYESLVVNRICRPLKMYDTRITLTPELKARVAIGHNEQGRAVPSSNFQTLEGAFALRSTANDMLKYLSANLGLTSSGLTSLMEKTHEVHFHQTMETLGNDIGLAWIITHDLRGTKIVWHCGVAPGYAAFAGFDNLRHRGVVILSSSCDVVDVTALGMILLESQWQSDKRPKETKISSQIFDSFVGQYQLNPDFALGLLLLRRILSSTPKAYIYIPAAFCVAVLLVALWRTRNFCKRCIILGSAALAVGLLAALTALMLSHEMCALFQPGMGIRREGNRIFAQATGLSNIAEFLPRSATELSVQILPRISVELLPESETDFFERVSGTPMTFSRDSQGKAARLVARIPGAEFSFAKISDQPPEAPRPPKSRAGVR